MAWLQTTNKEVLPRFCRACACELNHRCAIENNPGKPELPLLLKRYVPEFDIKVKNASLCTDCVSILYIFHNFKRRSLRTEQTINLHVRKHPEVTTANLNEIFAPKEQTNNTIDGIRPSLGTTATTEETIMKGPISDVELVLVPERTIEEEITEPPQTVTTEFVCEFCSRVFPRRQWLLSHKQKTHGLKSYQCDKCSRDFFSKKIYDLHLDYHKIPDAGRYTCNTCNFVYQSNFALKRHNSYKHSSEDQKRFKCEVCARRFVERSTLYDHIRTHTEEKLYYCSKCKYATIVMTELDRHIGEVHSIEAKMKVKCPQKNCRRPFSSKKLLEAHKLNCCSNRNERKRYQCDQCSRNFPSEKGHQEHVEYHKRPNAGRHTCKICNFVYHSHSSLREHNILKHMSGDNKRFQCEVCAAGFIQSSLLKVHMRMHTGEKPYKCPLCTYAARIKGNLYSHVRAIHTGIKVQFNGEKCVIIQ